MKTPHQTPLLQDARQRKKDPSPSGGVAGTCVVLWAVSQLACTGPAAQVRPLTPADCPPEAQDAMREWRISGEETAIFPVVGSSGNITVRRGYGASVSLLDKWGKAPFGTVLTGELVFGEERVYGRFTEARTPDGKGFPVCVQLVDLFDDKPGVELRGRPSPDTAVVYSNVEAQAVRK
jgi:serine/threonine-protein kinase